MFIRVKHKTFSKAVDGKWADSSRVRAKRSHVRSEAMLKLELEKAALVCGRLPDFAPAGVINR